MLFSIFLKTYLSCFYCITYFLTPWENKPHTVRQLWCTVYTAQNDQKYYLEDLTSEQYCSTLCRWFSTRVIENIIFSINSHFLRHLEWTVVHWKGDELFSELLLNNTNLKRSGVKSAIVTVNCHLNKKPMNKRSAQTFIQHSYEDSM